jgi:serine/threonine-protein kinase PknG
MTSLPLAEHGEPRPKCQKEGCSGHIDGGYCDTCGSKGAPHAPLASSRRSASEASTGPTNGRGATQTTGPTGAGTRRTRLGLELSRVPPQPGIENPEAVVLKDPTAEGRKCCADCGSQVGRARGTRPGLLKGFCPACGSAFDFEPKLRTGERVGRQYEVAGILTHGGLGWIYLARDTRVGQWVVLKGLLNAGDQFARGVAQAEKDALAQTHHPNIVEIVNYVEHGDAEYIVMEYVNGLSLKQQLDQRKEANGGRPDPFPVDQAIDYMLAILPALSYLHDRNLVYCDLKPDNVIQFGSRVKLIDLGAVRRFDVTSGDSYGTPGFQAPEIASKGVSVASDLYTVGRTLAVLTLDFAYQTKFRESLPEPARHPVLTRFSSFHRFLLKATAQRRADRFQSASEMREQLLGVLHEVVALTTGEPQPAPPAAFALPMDDDTLPPPAIDPGDPAATFLANLSATTPDAVLDEIDAAVVAGQVDESAELQLRRVRALIEAREHVAAEGMLGKVELPRASAWRVAWLRGVNDLASGSPADAVKSFERCLLEVPGELAPKLASALALEAIGDLEGAAANFGVVIAVDPSYVAAAMGLARCRASQGDVAGAIAAYDAIPRTHRAYAEAQRKAVELVIHEGWFERAGQRLTRLDVDPGSRVELEVHLLQAALKAITESEQRATTTVSVGGPPLDERSLGFSLEKALRTWARFEPDPERRCQIIDEANRARPTTLL